VIRTLLLYFAVTSFCTAQTNSYVIQQWNVEDGLPQSTVRCITQTQDGYIWVGTWNGLARFDGIRMTIFKSSNTPALISSNIMSLFTDRGGQLWIGTDQGGLVCYSNNQFNDFDSLDGISAKRILSINEDHSGRVWFATELGIYVYDGKRFLHFSAANGLPFTYANQTLPFPVIGKTEKMYLGFVGAGAIVSLNNDSLTVHESFEVGGYIITIDSTGTMWSGFRGKGFIRRKDGKEHIDRSFANEQPGETYILRNEEKWLLTPNDIRIISDSNSRRLETIDNISLSGITNVFEDREGNIWLGKEGGGLILLRKKYVEVLSKQSGFPADMVLCGLEDRSGNVWIGSWDGGLIKRTQGSNYFSTVKLPNNILSVYTLFESHDGTILAGAWGKGLYRIGKEKTQIISNNILNDNISIISVVEDMRGGLWVGTAHNGVVHIKGNEIKEWNEKTGLSRNRVNSILAARNGDIWISASANGVNRISNGTLTVYKKGSGLNDNFTSPMYEDGDGAIWIGTNNGLTRRKDGVFSYVTEAHGLFDGAIAQIIEDDLGNFWIGAIHGIYRVSKQELNDAADGKISSVRCFTIGKEDGMLNEETSGGGTFRCWKTSDGKLWFSTSQGVVIVDPRTVTINSTAPIVIIEDVWIENRPVPLQNEIVLEPGQSKIEIRYTGIHFTSPKKIRFKYQMDGLDNRWSDAGTNRFVQFTNLDPGEYTFRVKAENNAGIFNLQDASMRIIVLPPFYATWWFLSIMILFFLTIGPAIYSYRVRQLTHEKERQIEFSRRLIESQESERKRIAAELHDGLGQNLLIIKNKLLVALQSLSKQETTTLQVEEASDVVSNTIEEVRSISHNLRPHQLDQLGITKTIRSIARQVNESTAIEFSAEIQDIDGILSPEQEISLFRIVQESFNNIIKHSGATKVTVNVVRNTNAIILAIADNGKGISSSQGFGISGMQERAKMFGWELLITSQAGTELTVKIPHIKNDSI
jgi:signal transduction histidine kinase/ligand-binding sensor domain-containing protein